MAILSAIFSLIARQLSNILQAIFGWSITALFGKLPAKKQTALSVALILSIAWPVLVLGCFFPGLAAWALAFLPLHKWLSEGAMRAIWIALAVLVPLGVGTITRWITPPEKLHGGTLKTLLGGYVLTVGYFVAFLVTAITVPIVKVLSTARGWDDTHVYVQPKEGRYFQVLEELVAACDKAGAPVKREDVPAQMALASNVIQKLARPFLEPIVAARPQRLRGEQLEIYLYPADLLLRGKQQTVAHVRSAMTRTMLERHAYLVQECEAQDIQDEIQDLWEVYARHEGPEEIGASARSRLREIQQELDCAPVSFDAWTTLETSLRRLERALTDAPKVLPDDAPPDMRPAVDVERMHAPTTATADLVKRAVDEARALAKAEVALAKSEVVTEVKDAARSATMLGVAGGIALLALMTFAATMVVALAHVVWVPVVIAAALAAVTAGCVVYGVKAVPRGLLPSTRRRLAGDAEDARAHVRRWAH